MKIDEREGHVVRQAHSWKLIQKVTAQDKSLQKLIGMLRYWARIQGVWVLFLASEGLQVSEDNPIGDNIDSVGAEPSCSAVVRKCPSKTV